MSSLPSIGDLRQFLLMSRNTTVLKTRLNTLSAEISSGQVGDKVAALGGETGRLEDIDRQLKVTAAQLRANVNTAQKLTMIQKVLDGIDVTRNTLMQSLVPITNVANDSERSAAAAQARASLPSLMSQLNTRFGDQTLLAGNATDRAAVADAETLMADIAAALAGASSAQDVIDAVTDYFETPGGGFETNIYLGDSGGPVVRPTGFGETVSVDARADDIALRRILSATVIAGVVDSGLVALPDSAEITLLSEAGTRLLTAAKPLADLQGRIGGAEGQVEEARVRAQAAQAALTLARNDLVSVDPYKTATELQAVQIQLETHYALTARLSRLTLTEYL